MKLKCILTIFCFSVTICAEIYINEKGEDVPDGSPLSEWISAVFNFNKDLSFPGRIVYNDLQIEVFRKSCQPLILKKLEVNLKMSIYNLPGGHSLFHQGLAFQYIKYDARQMDSLAGLLYLAGFYVPRWQSLLRNGYFAETLLDIDCNNSGKYNKFIDALIIKRLGANNNSDLGKISNNFQSLDNVLTAWLSDQLIYSSLYCLKANKLVYQKDNISVVYEYLNKPNGTRIADWAFRYFETQGEKSIPFLIKFAEINQDKNMTRQTFMCIERLSKRIDKKNFNIFHNYILQNLQRTGSWHSQVPPLSTAIAIMPVSQIINFILDKNLDVSPNIPEFVKLLEQSGKIPEKARTLCQNLVFNDKTSIANQKLLLDFIFKYGRDHQEFAETLNNVLKQKKKIQVFYLTYLLKCSKNPEIVHKFLAKIDVSPGIGIFFLEYARLVKDYNKTIQLWQEFISLQKGYRKNINCDKTYSELIYLFKDKNNLTIENCSKILSSFSPNLNIELKDFAINPDNLDEIMQVYQNSDSKTQINIYYSIGLYAEDKYWPKEIKNIFYRRFKEVINSDAKEQNRIESKIIMKVRDHFLRKKIVDYYISILSDFKKRKLWGKAKLGIQRQGSMSIAPLKKMAVSNNVLQATVACNLLGEMSFLAETAIPEIEKAAVNSDWTVRVCAIKALGKINPQTKNTKDLLVKALNDEIKAVRQVAADALILIGKINDPDLLKKIYNAKKTLSKNKTRRQSLPLNEILSQGI